MVEQRRFFDAGNAPEFFASELYDVQILGPVSRFVMVVQKIAADGEIFLEPAFTCILPNEAIGPAISLTLRKLSSGVLVPAIHQMTRLLVRH